MPRAGLLFVGLSGVWMATRDAMRTNLLTLEDMFLMSFVAEPGDRRAS